MAYPFGYGLSYARFSYSDLHLSKKSLKKGEEVTISFTIKNESKIEASEIAQLYIGEMKSQSFKPLRELKDFARVTCKPGERKEVTMKVPFSSLANFDTKTHAFQTEAGHYCIEIGRSCEDIVLKDEIEVTSDFVATSKAKELPSYYAIDDISKISDAEFASLLKHPLRQEANREKRPYTINSTLYDCRKCWLAKFIFKKLKKSPLLSSFGSGVSSKDIEDQIKNTPIRFLGVTGIPSIFLEGYVDVLNLHYFRGIPRIIKGAKIMKKKK